MLPILINRPHYNMYRLIFTKIFRYCSHKCLYGEAGAAALIDTFPISTADGMPCRGKIAPYLGKTCFLCRLIIAL